MPPKIRPPHRLAPLFFKRQNAEAQLILYVGWCETRFNVTKGSDYILSYIFSVAETNTMVYAGVAATPFPRCSPPSSSKYRPSVRAANAMHSANCMDKLHDISWPFSVSQNPSPQGICSNQSVS